MKGDDKSMVNEGEVEKAVDNAKQAAAKEVAKSVATTAKNGAVEFKNYVVENPNAIKMIGLITGLGLAVFSIFGMINILGIANPASYVVNFCNILFGLMIVLVEGPPSWAWCGVRAWMFTQFGFLRSPIGRAFFYIYLGALLISIGFSDSTGSWIYYIMGGIMAACGLLQLFRLCKKEPKKPDTHVELQDSV